MKLARPRLYFSCWLSLMRFLKYIQGLLEGGGGRPDDVQSIDATNDQPSDRNTVWRATMRDKVEAERGLKLLSFHVPHCGSKSTPTLLFKRSRPLSYFVNWSSHVETTLTHQRLSSGVVSYFPLVFLQYRHVVCHFNQWRAGHRAYKDKNPLGCRITGPLDGPKHTVLAISRFWLLSFAGNDMKWGWSRNWKFFSVSWQSMSVS